MEVAIVLPSHLNGRADLALEILFLNPDRKAGQTFHLGFVVLDKFERFRLVAFREVNLQFGEELSCAVVNRFRPSVLHLRLREHSIKRFKRGVRLLRGVEGDGLAVVSVCELRIGCDGLLKQLDRFVGLAALVANCRKTVQCPRIVRRNLQSLAKKFLARVLVRFLADVEIGEDNPTPRVFRIKT